MHDGPTPARRAAAALGLGALLLAACGGEPGRPADPATAPAGPATLIAHSEELRREVVSVTDTVAVAVGFGLANAILVEGPDCAFVVDTLESRETGAAVREEFRKLTDKPIGAIVYTHNHADHIFGASAFAEGRDIDVYAHETTAAAVDRAINVIRPILAVRSARMFGTYLEEGENGLINAGIGPFLAVTGPEGGSIGYLPPTKTFADRLDTEICGRRVVMEHAPGETDDQIFVWLPDEKVLMPADNIYRTFPNLYTIRGTGYRDVVGWARSLDRMRALGAEHLVPSHTRPVAGAEEIRETLRDYADAIRFVHDQTVRGMNRGMTPDDLVAFVDLPPHLKSHPFLLEHYGTVRWSVRAIYDGYLGWFNGDGATLNPPAPAARAEAMAALAAAETSLGAAAEEALARGDFAIAAELASLAIDAGDANARRTKAAALEGLGRQSVSPNGRNYLLTQAGELRGRIVIDEAPDERSLTFVRAAPLANFMAALPVNLDAAAALDTEKTAEFRFTDKAETYSVEVRRGVAIVTPGPAADPDIVVETTSAVWIDMMLGERGAAGAIASGALKFPDGLGDVAEFAGFMALFKG